MCLQVAMILRSPRLELTASRYFLSHVDDPRFEFACYNALRSTSNASSASYSVTLSTCSVIRLLIAFPSSAVNSEQPRLVIQLDRGSAQNFTFPARSNGCNNFNSLYSFELRIDSPRERNVSMTLKHLVS